MSPWKDCICTEYGHGMNLTIVVRADCPVHGRRAFWVEVASGVMDALDEAEETP